MELKILRRQPIKLLSLILFWGVLSAASLFFALQYWIDLQNMEHIKGFYACTGTIIGQETLGDISGRDKGALLPIQEDAIGILERSDYVSKLDVRTTRSALLSEIENISSVFYSWDAGHLVILEGTVKSNGMEEGEDVFYGYVTLANPVIYSAHSQWKEHISDQIVLNYSIPRDELVPFRQGDRILVVCKMNRDATTGFTLYSVSTHHIDGTSAPHKEELSPFFEQWYSNAFTKLELDATNEQVQGTIQKIGMEPFVKDAEILDHVFTVLVATDMNLLLPITEEEMFYTEGRGITPEDVGKKVCVINRELAQQRNLRVGDSISISLSDGCYETAGYLSGYPTLGLPLTLPYANADNYEIIGIYSFTDYHHLGDPFQYSYNSIFIPAPMDGPEAGDQARPYTLSFQVPGEEYNNFMTITVPQLERLGYTVRLSNSKWLAVEGAYKTMEERRMGLLIAAASTFAVLCAMFSLLLGTFYQKEFALRKLLGTDSNASRRAYQIPYLVTTLVGSSISIGFVTSLYHYSMKAEIDQIIPGSVLDGTTIFVFLLAITVIQALLCYLLLQLWSRRNEKKALRILLK